MRGLANGVGLLAITTSLFALPIPVHGQGPSGPPPEALTGYYTGDHGKFFHSSSVTIYPHLKTLHYAVCNLDQDRGLIFRWDKPFFGFNGRTGLQFGYCATISQDTGRFAPDFNTTIFFAQNSQMKTASAYLPVLEGPESATSRIQGWQQIGKAPNIVDLEIQVTQGANSSEYTLKWSQGIPSVALGFSLKNLNEKDRQTILDALRKAGAKAEFRQASDFIAEADQALLGPSALSDTFLYLNTERTFLGTFSVSKRAVIGSIEPVLLLDGNGRVLMTASYRGMRW